jgi:uncharacterized protein (DUF1499 family)
MRRFVYDEPVTAFAVWSRRLAVLSLIVAGYAIIMVRSGVQDWRGAVVAGAALSLVALTGIVALVAMVRIWRNGFKGVSLAGQALALCMVMLVLPGAYTLRGLLLPQVTDVTTDIENPPEFSRSRAALAAREGWVPPSVDSAMRERQRAGYPALAPILLDMPVEEAFEAARKVATVLGWSIIEATPPGGRSGAGRIEATQRSLVLRFTDDITIRIRPRADGSRIDLRSASRIGPHDLGANARRISRFVAELAAQEAAK